MLLIEKNDFLFSFDLKSGYHHVDVAKEHWKYLGFSWGSCYYVFTVLPFGLASACYIFTKLVRPLVGYWRRKGLRIVVYLEDGLCAVTSEERAKQVPWSNPHWKIQALQPMLKSLSGHPPGACSGWGLCNRLK